MIGVWKAKALICTYKCLGSESFNFHSYLTPLFLEAGGGKGQALAQNTFLSIELH